MAFLKINTHDFSAYVNALRIDVTNNYNEQKNAVGDKVVDFLSVKRVIEVGIIPLEAETLKTLLADIESFNVVVDFLNPNTNALETGVNCIIPANSVEYYTIRAGQTMGKAFSFQLVEL
jgi:hypothetical protein